MSQELLYLPIQDPNILLEGCQTLLKSLIERIIEQRINGRADYTNERGVIRVKVISLFIEYF